MSRRPACNRTERNRRNKHLAYLRQQFNYRPLVDNTEVVAHIRHLRQHLSNREIGTRAAAIAGMPEDIPEATINHHHLDRGKGSKIREPLARAILGIRLTEADKITPQDRCRGAQRITRGLLARGFTFRIMAEYLPISHQSLANLSAGDSQYVGVSHHAYECFLNMAHKLDNADPAHHGITPRGINGNITRARNKGYAPLACWDLDTIHQADAYAEWTGECGTMGGYRIHLREYIKTCAPCLAAVRRQRTLRGQDHTGPAFNHIQLQVLIEADGRPYSRIATEAGVSQTSVKYWLRGEKIPIHENVRLIADALGVDHHQLYDEGTE